MSAVLSQKPAAPGADVNLKLNFQKNLQTVTNRIHATNNIDEIMLEVSLEICSLFNADRLTIYTVNEDKATIISKVKTGLNSFKDLKLPIAEQSVAGYVALSKKLINIRDVYDEAELKSHNPNLRFLQEVDKRTGYRTKQVLCAPVVDAQSGELIGVVQIINNKSGHPFGQLEEEGVIGLTQTLAIAFRQRLKAAQPIKTKYDYLVSDAVLSAQEFDLATRSARRKGVDVEEVLIGEFQVKVASMGAALSKYFGVPYEPYQADRVKPVDLLKNLKREYVETSQWVPVDDAKEGLIVLCLDPERIKSSRIVNNIFPRAGKVIYKVTTAIEFKQTLNSFLGEDLSGGDIDDILGTMDDEEPIVAESGDDFNAAADNELVKLVNKIIIEAYHQGVSDIHIEPYPGKAKTEIRFRKDGSLAPYIEIPASYRAAIVARIKIMCDLDISEKRRPQDGDRKSTRLNSSHG